MCYDKHNDVTMHKAHGHNTKNGLAHTTWPINLGYTTNKQNEKKNERMYFRRKRREMIETQN